LAGACAASAAGESGISRPIGVRDAGVSAMFMDEVVEDVELLICVSSSANRCKVENLNRVLLRVIRAAMFAAIASLRAVINLCRPFLLPVCGV
jgi:hypothetical protein